MGQLLRSEGHERIDPRGAACGNVAREKRDDEEEGRDRGKGERIGGRYGEEEIAQDARGDDACGNVKRGAARAHGRGEPGARVGS